MPRRPMRRHTSTLALAAMGSIWSVHAHAQTATPQPVPTTPVIAPLVAAPSTASPTSGAETLAALEAQLTKQSEAIAALQQAAEEAEMAAMMGGDEEEEIEEPTLKFYGFSDMGAQYSHVQKGSLLEGYFATNSATFVVGNLNLYLDAKPADNWRAMTEIRFTNAPQGEIDEFGVVLGEATITDFERRSVEQFDPHSATINAPVWPGTTVIERAWIEYNKYQGAKLRMGNFFTPFGIWNIDHGTPTLISLSLPQYLVQTFVPVRQTGVQLYGSHFAGDWELGYHLTFSNGRQELSNFDYDSDKALGARVFASNEAGEVKTKIAASFYKGNWENKVVNVVSISPLSFSSEPTIEASESVWGLDLSLDYKDFRLRAEYAGTKVRYRSGKRPAQQFGDGMEPDTFRNSGYIILAQRLPWGGIEPFIYADIMVSPGGLVPDGLWIVAPGFNVYLNPTVSVKFQAQTAGFFDVWNDFIGDPDALAAKSITTRLVVAF